MVKTHIIGMPSIGENRELKYNVEKFICSKKNKFSEKKLLISLRKIKKKNIDIQNKFLDINTIQSFPYYDKVVTTMVYLGLIPKRFSNGKFCMKKYFEISMGGKNKKPLSMTKWFNTNYHFMIPEIDNIKNFYKNKLINEDIYIKKYSNNKNKFSIIGPITFILISKCFKNKKLFYNIFRRYIRLFNIIKCFDFFQIEEPIIYKKFNKFQKKMFFKFYNLANKINVKKIFTTYFSNISKNINIIKKINTQGIHISLYNIEKNIINIILKNFKIISIGLIKGNNIWISNFRKIIEKISFFKKKKNNFYISTTCSMEHIPFSKRKENIKLEWIIFSKEKIKELFLLKKILTYGIKNNKDYKVNKILNFNKENFSKKNDELIFKKFKKIPNSNKILKITDNIPKKFPTTTIGSFPQTKKIRRIRNLYNNKKISIEKYEKFIKKEIKRNIKFQENINLDLVTNGEPERNDMVEYFCEKMDGAFITKNGWVHSYGYRCVKPPIIYGTVKHIENICAKWMKFTIKLTKKPIKAILTGPVTILKWSFIRNDIKKKQICEQLSLFLRKEVISLVNIGIKYIQIDEPAIKECSPLIKKKSRKFFKWAISCFNSLFSGIKNIQIHTHICYSKLNKNDIINISKMNINVLSIESSRSSMKILNILKKMKIKFEIGLGIYDIHSNICPKKKDIYKRIIKIKKYINCKRIWINPDCGLKTRNWKETKLSIKNMVISALKARKNL
ncbi:5-methyltetrahydropteroyltriglutamate--homocysteine S-methyltransferase [Candidatus Vidania fulgoroideorum]